MVAVEIIVIMATERMAKEYCYLRAVFRVYKLKINSLQAYEIS